MKMVQNSYFSVHTKPEVLLEHSHAHLFNLVCGCFHTTVAWVLVKAHGA